MSRINMALFGSLFALTATLVAVPMPAAAQYCPEPTRTGSCSTTPVNAKPVVSLTSPAAGNHGFAPRTLTLTANARDSDDGVASVKFYAGTQLIGTDTTAPYEVQWVNAPPGTHSLQAAATDTRGASTASPAVSITLDASRVIGNIDGIDYPGGVPHLRGWACTTGSNTSIDVHVYAGGAYGTGSFVTSSRAAVASEPAVAAACQSTGTSHRFAVPLTEEIRRVHGGRTLHVHGISPVGQPNNVLSQSGTFSVPGLPPPAPSPASITRRYVYDQHQQLCKVIEPETGSTVMAYDAAGNLAWSASGLALPAADRCDYGDPAIAPRASSRDYDARNRLKTLNFPDGRGNQIWSYTADGLPERITTYNDPGNQSPVVNTYQYNSRRMLTGEGSSQPGWYDWGLGYGYDAHGNLSTTTQTQTGAITYFGPNALGQPTQVVANTGTFATGVRYYPNGSIRQFTYGNGIVHTMEQNARQLPSRTRSAGASVPLDTTFTYDPNGNVKDIYDNARGGHYNRHMYYDGLDRLTAAGSWAFGGDAWHRFTYDTVDNIRSWMHAGGRDFANYYYEPGTNRLTAIQNSAGATVMGFAYDPQGNLRQKNGQGYDFDYGNRLRVTPDREVYRYDGHGRRVLNWRTPAAQGGDVHAYTLSVYSQAGQIMFEHTDKEWTEHYYLAGSLIGDRTYDFATGQVRLKYFHTDALGSPVATTDAAGQVMSRTEWEPYGGAIGKPAYQGIGYTGHVMDGATGLTYMQQRYYDSAVGRFLSVDPIDAHTGNIDHFNRYAYSYNNPYAYIDPDGRAPKEKPGCGTRISGRAATNCTSIEHGADDSSDTRRTAMQPQNYWAQRSSDPLYCDGGADCDFMYNQSEFALGNISREEFAGRTQAQGAGGTVGAILGLTMYAGAYAIPVLKEAGGLGVTAHGAVRLGAAATRGGAISRAGLAYVRLFGTRTFQADGARVFFSVNQNRVSFAVFNKAGKLVTSGGGWALKRAQKTAQRYGWDRIP
ncbi:RHS repeat-associated core domain-containing protein [Lysobacter humi (ex Lee et al. 2017)]